MSGTTRLLPPHNLDTDMAFMLVEIAGDDMYFQVLSRTGQTVDSGVITRRGAEIQPLTNATAKVF